MITQASLTGILEMSDELRPVYQKLGKVESDVQHVIARVDEHIKDSKQSQKELNSKIDEIARHVLSLNSVDQKLKNVGIDLEDGKSHQEDQHFLRRERLGQTRRNQAIEKVIIGFLLAAIMGFAGSAIYDKLIKNASEKIQQSSTIN